MRHIIFVYGTLLKGFGNHHRIGDDPESKFLGKDTLNASMYGRGIPIIDVYEPGIVHGELYEINDRVLASLDRLEGYDPRMKKTCGYVRVKVTTQSGVDTFVYSMPIEEHNQRDKEPNRWHGPKVAHGDYRKMRADALKEHGSPRYGSW